MAPPIVGATVVAAVLGATSNLLAQTITAFQRDTPLIIDYVPVFQFVLYAIINTPPNFLWQDFLESTFPAYHASPTSKAIQSASLKGEKADAALDDASPTALVEPKLNIRNTVVKLVLDQTLGAGLNTILFSLFIHSVQMAMYRPIGAPLSTPDQSIQFLLSGLFPSLVSVAGASKSFDFARVDCPTVVAKSQADFVPLMVAGWKLWPLVSLINYTMVKTIEGRSLVGGLAGVVWGIYMSLLAS